MLASGEQLIQFTWFWVWRDGEGEVDKLVRAVSHGGDNDHYLVAVPYTPRYLSGYVSYAISIGYGGPAELLDDSH
tara:strand:+ start:78 stop:302 length:225 start_codon:yes stop_codon:yes gene_type:complete